MEGITTLFFIVKILLLLPLLLGFSVPAIAHNEANGGDGITIGRETPSSDCDGEGNCTD